MYSVIVLVLSVIYVVHLFDINFHFNFINLYMINIYMCLVSSTFYYKYDEDGTTQAQLVDYTEQCFPLVSVENAKNAIPCQLLFIPDGIYLLQPALDIDCCK